VCDLVGCDVCLQSFGERIEGLGYAPIKVDDLRERLNVTTSEKLEGEYHCMSMCGCFRLARLGLSSDVTRVHIPDLHAYMHLAYTHGSRDLCVEHLACTRRCI
jgi:hypothetical protein